jgi:hypothetical protein
MVYEIEKNRIDLRDIQPRLLRTRHLLLLDIGSDKFVALRVIRQQQSIITYNFSTEISGFLPLAPVGSSGTTNVTQASFTAPITLGIKELSVDDALSIGESRQGNITQVFMGIAPSYTYVDLLQAGIPVDQLSLSAMSPTSAYPYIYGHSGFTSPYFRPSENTEFFVMANIQTQLRLANSVSIPISPKLLLVMNNMTVKPVDAALFKQMLEAKVPREVVTVGQIYSSITWSPDRYGGASPVSAKDVLAGNTVALKEGGY